MKLNELYNRLTRVPIVLDEVVRGINSLSEYIRYKSESKENPPFVLIFIQAVIVIKDDDGFMVKTKQPVTLSMSAYAPHVFSFQPDIPIAHLQIAIICDVSKVGIRDLTVANQRLCPSVESAPLAYYEGIVHPSNRITIDVVTR